MEHSSIVIDLWAVHEVHRVDEYFGSEFDTLEESNFGDADELDHDDVVVDLVGVVDEERAVLVGKIEACLLYFFFEPPDEP